ncbi:molybdopterin-guanine dinucleotide biosynthesis protein B [Gorillibacterium sp. sgz5001074]|uniref:molybdopterin-guanine dinucleotide biosynthesis protein B n=1 Tax=Gorillibacterium sp. sgz5001074 TaxID=3446695 RepID=UPI003F6633A7
MRTNGPVVVQVVGWKNAGKTTLVCKLVEALSAQALEVGTVKHDAHRFEIDHEGKDTWRHRQAGARRVAISSEQEGRTCYIEERYTPLPDMLERMQDMDYVVVEGFKSEGYPKIVIIRSQEQLELLDRVAPVWAVASWLPPGSISPEASYGAPVFDVNDLDGLLGRVLELWS